ncbi:MAG TPA: hypothetical protein VJY35_03975 [Candidatus Eisenbacteria bacterium]|nr:hypothetical protein [Candidatus Eisenbacteria bacterium]
MPHPATGREIIAALESNAQNIAVFYRTLPERVVLDGDSDHWGPAHHLVHLTMGSVALERGLRSGTLPLHSTGRSRTYAEVRDAATASLTSTPKDKLLDMGRKVMVAPDARLADITVGFERASTALRAAASTWAEDVLDRHAVRHPLMGELTVREMLLFFVVHERHHLKLVRTRLESQPPIR